MPEKIPLIYLKNTTLFPQLSHSFKINKKSNKKAISLALEKEKKEIVLVTLKKETTIPSFEDFYETGTLCSIIQIVENPNNEITVFLKGKKRVRLTNIIQKNDFYLTETKSIKTLDPFPDETINLRDTLEELLDFLLPDTPIPQDIIKEIKSIEDDEIFLDHVATVFVNMTTEEKQKLLSQSNLIHRYQQMISILRIKKDLKNIERKIDKKIKQKLDKEQKNFFIKQRIAELEKELHSTNTIISPADKTANSTTFEESLESLNAPQYVKEKLSKEFSKLKTMNPMSSEKNVIENYIQTIFEIPWAKEEIPLFTISKVKKILEKDHFGLLKVKERILEYLSVIKLASGKFTPPQILCLVGPPGTGKTSIASSIAKALNRKFIRMALGGMKDEAEIRGHRRTYIGAMPGRIMKSLIKQKTNSPVFLLDEIDKLGSDFKGDPSSALLEVLDPAQNSTFTDNFVDMPFDLSSVFFIATANDKSQIPPALRDRMEIIELNEYTLFEKKNIAKKHLIKKQKKLNALDDISLTISETTIETIITNYTAEAGVRELERKIGSICRKIAFLILNEVENSQNQSTKKRWTINKKNLQEFLGKEKYSSDKINKQGEIGIATGLAWTPFGGRILQIEAVKHKGKGKIEITGSLGKVMQESVATAKTFVRSISEKILKIDDEIWDKTDIHLHFPEGATPKDGPSAGGAIALVLSSIISDKKIKPFIAMTGEITLQGKILKIGGLRSKLTAASSSGIKKVFIPKDNISDLEEIPDEVKNKLEIVAVSSAKEIIENSLEFN